MQPSVEIYSVYFADIILIRSYFKDGSFKHQPSCKVNVSSSKLKLLGYILFFLESEVLKK